MSKICSKCKGEFPISMFASKKEAPDGHRYECKLCQYGREKLHYWANHTRRSKSRATPEIMQKYEIANKAKRRAKNVLNNALRKGRIVSRPCLICKTKAHAHHYDYKLPLDVLWLCPKHHKAWHRVFSVEV